MDNPQVMTRNGALEGLIVDDIAVFRGVPFAQPPVGDLRWRPPQPFPAWSGVRDATQWGHIAMQPQPQPKDVSAVGETPPSEDCLTLNVWTPVPGSSQRLPVMVWIHGGGFTIGSGISAQSDGGRLARQGVVVVSINYRLGRFGFFAHPALTAEARGGEVANYGLMDQIAALKWVRENIAAFGGDPDQMTIFGSSAGGHSVLALMASPKARNLFQAAIAQSPPARSPSQTLTEAEAVGVRLASAWNAADGSAQALRAVPADRILDADTTSPLLSGEMPITDGSILTAPILSTFEAGEEAPVPLIIGATDYELPPLIVPPELRSRVAPYDAAEPGLRSLYPSADAYDHYLSDAIFAEPAARIAALHQARQPTFRYRFSALPESLRAQSFTGAFHSMEGSYVFGTLDVMPWPVSARDHELAEAVGAYWVAFAKTGTPAASAMTAWPGAAEGWIMDFTHDGPAAAVDDRLGLYDALASGYAAGRLRLLLSERNAVDDAEIG